jgi:hypothetical protein
MTAPVLSIHDLGTDTWRKIKEHLTERIAELRAENDADMDERQTAKKRGRISEAKYLLEIGDPTPKAAPIVEVDSEYE